MPHMKQYVIIVTSKGCIYTLQQERRSVKKVYLAVSDRASAQCVCVELLYIYKIET